MHGERGELAREVARQLADELDPSLPIFVERALNESGGAPDRGHVDTGSSSSLAFFVLRAVARARAAHRDLRNDLDATRPAISPRHALVHRLRQVVGRPQGLSAAERDRVLEVAVDEVLRQAAASFDRTEKSDLPGR